LPKNLKKLKNRWGLETSIVFSQNNKYKTLKRQLNKNLETYNNDNYMFVIPSNKDYYIEIISKLISN